jgi:hypothetical protein
MAAAVSGSKTLTRPAADISAAVLTAILATAPENLTVQQLAQLTAAIRGYADASQPAATIGSILS